MRVAKNVLLGLVLSKAADPHRYITYQPCISIYIANGRRACQGDGDMNAKKILSDQLICSYLTQAYDPRVRSAAGQSSMPELRDLC